MIETYKIITRIYDKEASPVLKLNLSTITRGSRYKLDTHRTKYDLRKYFFTNRIVNVWNSLPDTVVMSETVKQFKNRLDTFWSNRYNYKAKLAIEIVFKLFCYSRVLFKCAL